MKRFDGPLVVPYLGESLRAFRTPQERPGRGRGRAFLGNRGCGSLATGREG